MQPFYQQQLQDPLFNQNSDFYACNRLEINFPTLVAGIGWGRKFRGRYWRRDAKNSCNNFLLRTGSLGTNWELWYLWPGNRGISVVFVPWKPWYLCPRNRGICVLESIVLVPWKPWYWCSGTRVEYTLIDIGIGTWFHWNSAPNTYAAITRDRDRDIRIGIGHLPLIQ